MHLNGVALVVPWFAQNLKLMKLCSFSIATYKTTYLKLNFQVFNNIFATILNGLRTFVRNRGIKIHEVNLGKEFKKEKDPYNWCK